VAVSGLAILLLAGLLLRLAVAYVLLPNSGAKSDIGDYVDWASRLVEHGPGTFYTAPDPANYPPGYMYVLWLIGGIGHLLSPLADGDAEAVTAALIKLPPMLADILVGFLLFRVVRSWLEPRRDARRLALLAAAIYVFNPVTWYDSAIWGQTDAIGALMVLVTVAALVRGNSEGSAALAVLAALIKPQFGVVLLPVVGVVLLRRHLFGPQHVSRHPVLLPPRWRRWFENERGAWRLVSSAVVALIVVLVLLAPFSMDVFGYIRMMSHTANNFRFLSVNAYNPWALIGAGGAAPLAFGGDWSLDTVPLLGPLPGLLIGAALLVVAFAVAAVRAWWSDDRRSIVIITAFLTVSFFILPTRVHERYMLPVFALLPVLAVVDRRWLLATILLSIGVFMNLHGILGTVGLPFGDLFHSPPGILISLALSTSGFAFVAWQLRPAAAAKVDPFAGAAKERTH
jgi:hypothetical protein